MTRPLLAALLLLSAPARAFEFEARPIRAHMQFLASDLLEGRGAGTRGYDVAAAYVASQFEAAGVLPGADGRYEQIVPFLKTKPDPQSAVTLIPDSGPSMTLRFGDGFVTQGDPLHGDRTIQGRLAVVGYGVTAPQLGHDDYAGIDVKGKIVIVFSGAPSRFAAPVRAHYSSSLVKIGNAAAHGAIGMITLTLRESSSTRSWKRTVRQSRLGAMHWLDAGGTPHGLDPQISSTAVLNPDAAGNLFRQRGRSFAQVSAAVRTGRFRSFDLPFRAAIRTISSHERVKSANVVGLVPGNDPALGHEYLVYSSHLDHLGITEPVEGDAINNGAFDNASGIAALLEIARAFAAQKPAPRRSILFLATTAEEKGLRGADYFANFPTVPRSQLIGDINIDQVMMRDAVRDMVVHGIDASTLGDAARRAASRNGVILTDDPFPDEVYFVRSDQYPFIRQGIPALYIHPGYRAIDPAVDAKQNQREWIRTRYHTPADDLQQTLDYSMPAAVARFAFLVGLEAANADERPVWKRGNFFGEMFGVRP